MSDLNLKWLSDNFFNKEIIFFDIGCADMYDTLLFKQSLPDAKFYAFDCNNYWLHNNYIKSLHNGIYYYHCAISDIDGVQMFYPSNTFHGEKWPYSGSICYPNNDNEFEWGIPYEVQSIRLDTFCNNFNITPDFIHIDVQGAEYKVLSTLGNYRPKCIWAEIVEFQSVYNTGITYDDFNKLMKNYGYTILHTDLNDELYVLNDLNLIKYY